jgi:hypothetical protein
MACEDAKIVRNFEERFLLPLVKKMYEIPI